MSPDFLGLGAHKSGSTWLHEMLDQHPEIALPPGKELHFWDRCWHEGSSLEGYEETFASLTKPIKGEITPAYAILPPPTIMVIRKSYPGLRLLYVLRDPIERAWSHARMGFAKTFPDPAEDDVSAHADWFLEHFRSVGSLARGDYPRCIANWEAAYPSGALLTLLYDDMQTSPREFLRACCRHLGADPEFFDTLDTARLSAKIYPEKSILKSRSSTLPQKVPERFVAPLLDIYLPKVGALSAMLRRDLSTLWLSRYI